MPQFLIDTLKKEYGANSDIPYRVLNSKGLMRGNKETAKGKALDKKHKIDADEMVRGLMRPKGK